MNRRSAAVGLLALLIVACGPASASPSWSVVPSPRPPGASSSELDDVSCPSATICFAVGNYYTSSGNLRSLSERMNGTRWSVVPMPNPKGVVTSRLDGVSCPTVSFCAAVGTYSNGTAQVTLIAHWNTGKWTIVPSPNRVVTYGSSNRLTGVSCTSATNCFAVGATGGPHRTLVERWNGKSWTIVASPNPQKATNSALGAVSCADATHCMATGDWYVHPREDGGTTTTLTERWNGKTWTIVASPNPKDSVYAALGGVDCTAAASCIAVGRSEPSERVLIERWNGTKWSIVAGPSPAGTLSSTLGSVSCPTTKRCFAAGAFLKSGGGGGADTLIERYDGTKWSIAHTAAPKYESVLGGISCATEQRCIAVGSVDSQTLVERYA